MGSSFTETALNELQLRVALVDRAGAVVYANRSWTESRSRGVFPAFAATEGESYLEALSRAEEPEAHGLAETVRALLSGSEDGSVVQRYRVSSEPRPVQIRLSTVDHDGARHVLIVDDRRTEGPTRRVDTGLKERAIDESPIGISITGPSTEEGDNPLVYVNDAFERITGYSREEALGNDCRFLQGEETSEEAVEEMAAAIEADEPVTVVIRNYRKDGEPFWNEVTIAPLYDRDGNVTNFVGFQQDVTEKEETKRELETERDRLDLLNQIVRHDIRNDMSVVLGWADVLEEHVDPEGMEAFERILDAATHTRDLTESVRDITEVLGAAEPVLEPTPLAAMLRTEIEQVRSNFDYRLESLTIECEDVPDDLEVRATQLLSSVFTNLLNNAVLHNDTDDVEIEVSVDVGEEMVAVHIADNGPGIPDAQKTEIFGKGTQGLDSAGTGLGLYLVDNLVDTYGGDVRVADNDSKGSVFTVELRRA